MRSIALVLFLLLLLRGLIWGAPQPGEQDPSLAIRNGSRAPRVLVGRVLADARQFDPGCSVLLEVQRLDGQRRHGRSELQWRQCGIVLRQGWRVRAVGDLRQPAAGVHPFLPGAAERLASRGSWSQLRVSELEVLERPWTPLADGRRSIAQRMQRLAGPERGGLLAALVLGGAQVPLPDSLRQSFRVAGLSHALAASGFHLSVLLGAALSIGRLLPRSGRLAVAALALAGFLMLAGPQPSVVRAVLMGGIALLIRESGERSRGFGVLLLTLNGMLLLHPAWARSLGFQLSAAATAGLMLTAPGLEQCLIRWLPRRCRWLAPALSVPLAAMAWTLPLQLLHFGSTPLYALPANLLAAPLLAPLTLSAIALALGVLVLPPGVLQLLCWPVQQLAGALIVLVNWISSWPAAQLLTGRPQPWLVLLLAAALLPWLLPAPKRARWAGLLLLPVAVGWHVGMQLADGLVSVHRHGRHWLLARHRGRAALVVSHADQASCRMARLLMDGYGHQRLDWLLLLDPVPAAEASCWQGLARHVSAMQQGQPALAPGQRLISSGLSVELLAHRGEPLLLRIGRQSWQVLLRPQSLWSLQDAAVRSSNITGTWLGFRPSSQQRRWLMALGGSLRVAD